MTLDRMKLSAQTVRENIAFFEEVQEHYDTGYYLHLEHEKFVLECIEKQIPKKPFIPWDSVSGTYYCPNCDEGIIIDRKKYCSDCGQALDWSDTE